MSHVPTTTTGLLRDQVLVQAEYLFSAANLQQDRGMRVLMANDASGQGACTYAALTAHHPRLRQLAGELAAREAGGADLPPGAEAKALAGALDGSRALALNRALGTAKRSVFSGPPPALFDPSARPPPPDQVRSPARPEPPRETAPRIWFDGVDGWDEEFPERPTAFSKATGECGRPRRALLAWRPVTPAERATFQWCDYVVRRLFVVDLPAGGERSPQMHQWDHHEFFMTAEQLRMQQVPASPFPTKRTSSPSFS